MKLKSKQTLQFPTIFVRIHKAFLSPQKQPTTAYDSTGQPTACRRFSQPGAVHTWYQELQACRLGAVTQPGFD